MKRPAVFLTVLILVLFVAHYVGYLLVANALPFLAISHMWIRIPVVLIVASFFVLTSIWVNRSDSHRAQAIYRLSAYWIGFFFYLFLSGVLWAILMLFFPASSMGIAEVLLLTALALSIYGARYDDEIIVKYYTVPLPNTPTVWRAKKIVIISDLHLGAIRGRSYTERIVSHVGKLTPDIVFIIGDMFDGVKLDEARAIEPFTKLTPKDGVYFVAGNHEGFTDSTSKLNAIRNVGITILNNAKVDIDGTQLIGVDYMSTRKVEDLRHVLEAVNIDRTKPSILLKHAPTHIPAVQEAGINLLISGHTHNGQQVPANVLVSWVHKGYGYGLRRYRGMHILVSSGIGTWGPPLRVGTDNEIVTLTLQ